jgi:hypothetical protein
MKNQHAEAGKSRWVFSTIIHIKMDRENFVDVTSKANMLKISEIFL